MLPLAHIGTAVLLSKAARASTPFAVLGTLTPDLVDKPAAWLLKVAPRGRYLGHTLLSCLLLSLALAQLSGPRASLGFGLGYLSHLLGDSEDPVPWLVPLVRYDYPRDNRFRLDLSRRLLLREAVGLALIVFFARRSRRGKA